MVKLIALFFGTILLMFLSQKYYPGRINHRHSGSFIRLKSDRFMILAIFWMTCFMFLRTSYNDTTNYILFWRIAPTVQEFFSSGERLSVTGNPLSYLWESFSHQFLGNHHNYFLLPATLICVAVIKLFKRYSGNPWFSMLVFYAIGTFAMYMAALKQCFAMFFLLLSIPYAEKRQYGKFYLLVFLAILFHTHAFMFAIVPFLFEKPWGKITWLGLAAVVFMIATYNSTLGAFMRYAQSIGALVDEGELFDGHAVNILRVLVYWVPPLIALIFRTRLFNDSTRMENLFVNMSTVAACILSLGMVQAANLFARMAGYFEIGAALALPWMLKKIFAKESEKLVLTIAAGLYFVYFIYEFGVSKGFDADYGGYQAISLWEYVGILFGG